MRALSVEATPETSRASIETPSFARVYEQAFPWVFRAARRLGVPHDQLDDVVQDVFVVVHRKLASFEGRSSLRSWIFGITLHVVRARRRSMRRRPEDPAESLDAVADGSRDPQAHAMKREALAALLLVLDALPEEQREVFVLAELEELTAPEIVEATGANLNTVYSRLRAARRAFEAEAARIAARERFDERSMR